jgi:hypothetical protein
MDLARGFTRLKQSGAVQIIQQRVDGSAPHELLLG